MVVTQKIIHSPNVLNLLLTMSITTPGRKAIIPLPDENVARKKATKAIRAAAVLVAQLETPLETVQAAAEIAAKAGVRFILNPAPARALPDSLLKLVSIITPNETEAELLTGVKVTDEATAVKSVEVVPRYLLGDEIPRSNQSLGSDQVERQLGLVLGHLLLQ